MAWASKGTLGHVNSVAADQSTLVLTTTTTVLSAGDVGVISIAVDNNSGANNADESAVTGVVDSAGNSWIKIGELTSTPGTPPSDGATSSLWYVRATSPLSIGGTITTSFNNPTSRDAAAATAWAFTVAAGHKVTVQGFVARCGRGTSLGPVDVTTPNEEFLRVMGVALQALSAVDTGPTSNWTKMDTDIANSGAGGTSMSIGAEFHIATGTADPTNMATGLAGTREAGVMGVLRESKTILFPDSPSVGQQIIGGY